MNPVMLKTTLSLVLFVGSDNLALIAFSASAWYLAEIGLLRSLPFAQCRSSETLAKN